MINQAGQEATLLTEEIEISSVPVSLSLVTEGKLEENDKVSLFAIVDGTEIFIGSRGGNHEMTSIESQEIIGDKIQLKVTGKVTAKSEFIYIDDLSIRASQ